MNAGNALAAAGFGVDYFTWRTFIGGFDAASPNISLYRLEEQPQYDEVSVKTIQANYLSEVLLHPYITALGLVPSGLRRAMIGILGMFTYKKRLLEAEKRFLKAMDLYVDKAESIIGNQRYKCFIGVEPGGLMAAVKMGQKMNVPIIYYNLELHLFSETNMIVDKVSKKYKIYIIVTLSLPSHWMMRGQDFWLRIMR